MDGQYRQSGRTVPADTLVRATATFADDSQPPSELLQTGGSMCKKIEEGSDTVRVEGIRCLLEAPLAPIEIAVGYKKKREKGFNGNR